jgi:hypothetical protein
VSVVPRHTASETLPGSLQLRVDVLDGDRGLVHQDADRQGQPAQRHQVQRQSARPQGQKGREQGEGDVQHHHDYRAPVLQEDQDHQPREGGPDQALRRDAPHGPVTCGGLVEVEAQADALRQ